MGGRASTVHDSVGHALDVLVFAFSWVLVLLMGFTLPISDDQVAEDVLDATADLHLGTVTDKPRGCTTTTDDILEGVDKSFLGFQGVDITNSGCEADKELGNRYARVNRRGIRVDGVGGNGFITPMDIEGREG